MMVEIIAPDENSTWGGPTTNNSKQLEAFVTSSTQFPSKYSWTAVNLLRQRL